MSRSAPIQPNSTFRLTITKIEHIEALMEALHMYAPQIEYGRRRDED